MRLMEGGGVGSNYSTLFINSRDGNKPWQPKSKVNLHLICHPSHQDYYSDVEIANGEEKYLDPDYDKKTEYGFFPKISYISLLSKKYNCDWDPRISNGEGAKSLRVDDSREGWAEAVKLLLDSHMTTLDNRDIVIDVSNIRPKGAILKGFGGKASGPDALILLLRRINLLLNSKVDQNLTAMDHMLIDHYIAQAVVSGGVRRSARMSMKYWKDIDIFEFINCKKTGTNQISKHWTTNISVVVDRKFFRALKRKDPHAEKVYDLLAEGASTNGEPGIINASKALEGEAPGTVFFVTNPCVVRDTTIMTQDGAQKVENLIGKSFTAIVDGSAFISKTGFFSTGTKEVYRVETSRGFKLECTDNHKLLIQNSGNTYWKELKEIEIGDQIVLHNHQKAFWKGKGTQEEGWLLGNLVGDGNITKEGIANLDYWGAEKQALRSLAYEQIKVTVGLHTNTQEVSNSTASHTRISSKGLGDLANVYNLSNKSKLVTSKLEEGTSREFYCGFLSGWFDADGSVQGTTEKGISIRLSSNDYSGLEVAQRMLLRLGILSTIYMSCFPHSNPYIF